MVKKYKVSKNVSKEPALIIYDQIMLTPGIWNGVKFSKDQIEFGITNTDWTNPENFALIDEHTKDNELPNSMSWQGYFDEVKYKTINEGVEKEGMYGDLYIYDPVLASKILSKRSPLAVSIDASYSRSNYGVQRLSFTNTALVYRPGCLDAYIQLKSNGNDNRIRIVCEEDVSIIGSIEKNSEEKIKSVKLSYDLETDKIVQVYSKENELIFEGSVLSFRKVDEIVIVSIINECDKIMEFSINDFLFFPIMPRMIIPDDESKEELNEEEIGFTKLDGQLENVNRVIREDKKFKMNSNNIESLDARISLIEKKIEQFDVKLSESEEPKEEIVSEEKSEEPKEEPKEEVKEEVELKSSESEESKEEVESEEPKVEEPEVVEESVESKEETEEETEEEHVQESSIEQLKSEISELKAKLAEKDEVKEDVKLESDDEKKVAQSKTAVQLESSEEPKVEEKVQLSKTESILARLNNEIQCTRNFSNKE